MLFVLLQGIFSYHQRQVIFHGLQNSAKNQTPCNRNDNANKFTPFQKISYSEQSRPVMSLCCIFQQQVIPSIFCESPKLCFLTLPGAKLWSRSSHMVLGISVMLPITVIAIAYTQEPHWYHLIFFPSCPSSPVLVAPAAW